MKRSKLTTVAALLTVSALTLTACARGEQGTEDDTSREEAVEQYYTPGVHEEEPAGEPTAGGSLTIADYAETRSLDPTKTIATGYSGGTSLVAVYDQLIRWNEREQAFEPRLAESVEPNQDHTQWTIKLREGVNFSDGTPLNADAVIGSFNYYIENKGYDLGVVGPLWAGAEKVDDMTVQVNLRESWTTFPFALGMGMGLIVAPSAIANGADGFEPIGAGAFTLESYAPSEELVLTKNPNYWDGEVYLDELRLVWLGADETKLESMNGGNVNAAVIRDIRVLKQARDEGYPGWVNVDNIGNVINVNRADGRPASEYPQIAQALAHGVDEQGLYDRVFDGLGLPSKHLFGTESPWHDEDVPVVEYDVAKSTELLEEAKADGFDGHIVLTSLGDPISRDQGLTLQAQLEAAGFTVENDFVRTVADVTSRIYVEKDYDFARTSLSVTDADPYWRLYSSYYSTSAANASAYANPEYDALLDELRGTELDERGDVLSRIAELFNQELPGIVMASNPAFVAWGENVHGVNPTNDAMIGFEKAWISN